MNKNFYYSQKSYLFFIYGLFITLLLSIFFVCFYFFYSENIIKDAKVKSESICASVNKSLSTELNNISTISMNIVYSNAIKKNFTSIPQDYNSKNVDYTTFSSARENVLAIYDIITAIIGPFQSATQVNLYTLNGTCIGSGYFQGVTTVNFNNISWYEPTIEKNGSKHISSIDRLPNTPSGYRDTNKYITLTRLFFDSSNHPDGIVEVIQNYNVLFSLISELQIKNPSTSFYIYNEQNELIYPYKKADNLPEIDYLNLIKTNNLSPSSAQIIDINKNDSALITYEKIYQYDWTIIISEPQNEVFKSLNSFKISFIIIMLFSVCFTLILCFIISSRITYPLSKLSKAAKKVTLNSVLNSNKTILAPLDTDIQEIFELYNSFLEMYDKLRDSSQEILLLRSEETRAKLQATQSLVNPHFLYNSLTNISIMAEEDMNDDIVNMCDALCSYFRYISESKETAIHLHEEISFTEKYIECMKLRYGTDFIYHSDIDERTKDIFIPKLIIQPLVENAFKYGFSSSPPWYLKITSTIENDSWLIKVEDNGGCLSNEKKEELLHTFYNLDKNEELKYLKIGGMGLKNIYLRLKLLYNEKSVFEIDNSIAGKTIFIIGGPINLNKEEFYEQYTQI